ncbi:MAG: hypothetical protein LUG98_09565 [Tannerellaceae bacterium]|nr:hypothetical protein [Tannerellaceae bacterium]
MNNVNNPAAQATTAVLTGTINTSAEGFNILATGGSVTVRIKSISLTLTYPDGSSVNVPYNDTDFQIKGTLKEDWARIQSLTAQSITLSAIANTGNTRLNLLTVEVTAKDANITGSASKFMSVFQHYTRP